MTKLLYSAGFRQGDKVALLSQNMPNWVIAYFSIVQAGMIVIPMLPDFSQTEVETVLLHSESKGLFVSERLLPKIADQNFPDLTLVISTDNLTVIPEKTTVTLSETHDFVRPIVGEDDLAAIIYTSGTTGRSKGVMLTHKNITWNSAQAFVFHPIDSNDVFLSFLPLSHTYENTIGMIYPLMFGAAIYYLDKAPTPTVLMAAMAKIRPTIMVSVPLIMEKIYKSQIQSKFNKNNFKRAIYRTAILRILIHRIAGKKLKESFGGRLRFFGIGGSKLDTRVERFLREAKFPYAIGYGLTETAPLLAGAGVNYTKLRSTGFAVPGVTIKLHEPDKQGVGEIWVKGPNVMKGYYKSPDLTAEVITPDGWFKTGDLGYMNKKGRLYINGRKKNTIIGANGENIYPEDIESIINNTPYVTESLVIEENGFLIAKVLLNIDELETQIDNFREIYESKLEQYQAWKAGFVKELNAKLNRVSQIKNVQPVEEPFEKTASLKIKRFLYTKIEEVKSGKHAKRN
jgi:long-chain acyl-CoA synthetase